MTASVLRFAAAWEMLNAGVCVATINREPCASVGRKSMALLDDERCEILVAPDAHPKGGSHAGISPTRRVDRVQPRLPPCVPPTFRLEPRSCYCSRIPCFVADGDSAAGETAAAHAPLEARVRASKNRESASTVARSTFPLQQRLTEGRPRLPLGS